MSSFAVEMNPNLAWSMQSAHRINDSTYKVGDQFRSIIDSVYTPKQYAGDVWEQYNASVRDSASLIQTEATQYINKEILNTLHFKPRSAVFSSRNIGGGLTQYKYFKNNYVSGWGQTQDFSSTNEVKTTVTSVTEDLVGLQYDHTFSKTDIDAMNNSGAFLQLNKTPLQNNLDELMLSMTDNRERVIWRGTDSYGFTDSGVKGVMNTSGITALTNVGIGSDQDITATGDGLNMAMKMATALTSKKFEPPFVLDVSPGVYAQLLANQDNYVHRTDLELINRTGLFSEVRLNAWLVNTEVDTNSTGAAVAYKPDYFNQEIVESYPIGYYPMPQIDLGLRGKLLWMGKMVLKRPTSVVKAENIRINTMA